MCERRKAGDQSQRGLAVAQLGPGPLAAQEVTVGRRSRGVERKVRKPELRVVVNGDYVSMTPGQQQVGNADWWRVSRDDGKLATSMLPGLRLWPQCILTYVVLDWR